MATKLTKEQCESIRGMMLEIWKLHPNDNRGRRVECHLVRAAYDRPTAFVVSVEGSPPRGTILFCMDYPCAVTVLQGESKRIKKAEYIRTLTKIGRSLGIEDDCGL